MRICRSLTATLLLAAAAAGCDSTQNTPSITLTIGSEALTLTQGQSQTVIVSVARSNFSEDVSLVVTGGASGVTAEFNPASLSGSATAAIMNVSATNVAAPGPGTLTVTALADGIESRSATLAVTVDVAGNYTLSVPASTSVRQGSSSSTTVGVARTGGFAQDVELFVGGMPSGVTASFAPPAASGASSLLTLNATPSAPLGSATLSITGITPGLTDQTATLSMSVLTADPCGAEPLGVPESVSGTLSSDDCQTLPSNQFVDNYRLSESSLPAMRIDQRSTAIDSRLVIHATPTFRLTINNTSDMDAGIRLMMVEGTQDIGASSGTAGETGGYTLETTTEPESATSCALTYLVRNITTSQSIASSDCVDGSFREDVFVFMFETGRTYTVRVTTSDFDPWFQLAPLGSGTTYTKFSTGSGVRTIEQVVTATTNHIRVLFVSTNSTGQTGDYTLLVSGSATSSAGTQPAGATVAGVPTPARAGSARAPDELPSLVAERLTEINASGPGLARRPPGR